MNFDFKGKSALVTGGTRGIGWAIACALADAGCQVVAADIAAHEVPPATPGTANPQVRELDVASQSRVDQCVDELSHLDILVNCAGIIRREGREFQPTTFAEVLDVNLTGTMRMCHSCHRLLAASGGCIVNIASMLSFFGSGTAPAYSSSKGGIAQLTKSLAVAWADDGVRVNGVAPGWIETELTEPLRADPKTSETLLQRTPLGRWGQPEEIAPAVLFLCSPGANFITGVILPVDGGYSIR